MAPPSCCNSIIAHTCSCNTILVFSCELKILTD
jgi:hypothetical protein